MLEPEGAVQAVRKIPTGIKGFDVMTNGGLAAGRTTVLMGAAGVGKSVFAMQALLNAVNLEGGSGVFVCFEQTPEILLAEMASLDWGIAELVRRGKVLLLDGRPRLDAIQSGKFDIEGLLAAIRAGAPDACCVVYDGIDALLTMLHSPLDQRLELLRLQAFNWDSKAMNILTVKAGGASGSNFAEAAIYMVNCAVILENHSDQNLFSRRLRIQKYRSSAHNENWAPYLITDNGIEVDVIEASSDGFSISSEKVSTGVSQFDAMIGGGIFRGSSTLFTGAPGTAKTTLAIGILKAACQRGERALCVCFDESPAEIERNLRSVGIELAEEMEAGRLRMVGLVARSAGPDILVHFILKQIQSFQPQFVMIDPISVFTDEALSQTVIRLLFQTCKRAGITVVLTSLLEGSGAEIESSQANVSTICDNWIQLSYVVKGGERNRALTIVKSRGTMHSNQVAELFLSREGISIADAYMEDGDVLMGSLRWQKERSNQERMQIAREQAAKKRREAGRAVDELSSRIAMLTEELASKREELATLANDAEEFERSEAERRIQLSKIRSAGGVLELAGSTEKKDT